MKQIQIPNVRKGNSVVMHVTLTDTGVAVHWDSLSDIRVLAYSVNQRQVAALLTAEVDGEDATKLNVTYAGDQQQYLGVCKVVVRCTYQGAIKTYDAPAVNFVDNTGEATGVIDVEGPDVDVMISVADVSPSILDEAIAAALDAAALANEKAGLANEAAARANEKAALANSKAELADTKAGEADEAATRANTAAENVENDHQQYLRDHATAEADHQTWAGYRIVVNSIGATAPANPSSGDRWYNTTDNKVYTYTDSWDSGVAATVGATVVNSTTNDVFNYNGSGLAPVGGEFATGEEVKDIGLENILIAKSQNLVKGGCINDSIGRIGAVGKKYLDLNVSYDTVVNSNYKIENGVITTGTASQSVTYTSKLVKKGSILKVERRSSVVCTLGISADPVNSETLTETVLTILFSGTSSDDRDTYVIVPFDGYVVYYKNGTTTISVYNTDVPQGNNVLDVSELNDNVAYTSLAEALATIPNSLRQGGMSIRFIYSDYEVTKTTDVAEIPDGAIELNLGLESGDYTNAQMISAGVASNQLPTVKDTTKRFYTGSGTYTVWAVTMKSNGDEYVHYLLTLSTITTAEFRDPANWLKVDDVSVQVPLLVGAKFSTGSTLGKTAEIDANYSSILLSVYPGDRFYVEGAAGTSYRIYATYNSEGNRVRLGPNTYAGVIEISGNEKYIVLNFQKSKDKFIIYLTSPVPSRQFYENSIALDAIAKAISDLNTSLGNAEENISRVEGLCNEGVKTTPQSLSSSQKAQARQNIGAAFVDENYPTFNAEHLITWKTGPAGGYVIQGNGTLKNTSLKNEVGVVDIRGCKTLKFNFYIRKGGDDTGRRGFLVTTAAGVILLQSTEYSKNQNTGPIGVVLNDIPSEAALLYISWSATYANTQHYLISNVDIGILYSDIGALNSRVSVLEAAEESNVENAAIQLYRTVRYNNNDYSYTRLDYVTNLIRYPNYQLPAPVVFKTRVDSSAQSRHLMIADNSGYIGAYTIAIDLTSEQVEVYNFEPGKEYYYKVYKDNDPTAVIGGGLITTTGQIRFVKIAADVATNEHDWIDNVRDLGGWPASGNRRLRYGVIFRGEQLNNDDETVTYITQAGIQELRRLGVSAELDLRGGAHTQSVLGSDVAYANIALDLWFYRLNIYNTVTSQAQAFASAIRQILTWLEAGEGTYIHCAGGCDRTGALCAMIEGLCGVSENDINHDYEISNRSRAREYYTIAGGDNYDGDFKFAMEYIKGLIEYNGHIYVYYRGSYYDAEATVTDYTPVPLTDATLIANLAANNYGSLQDRFERLMCGIGDLTRNEVERLRTVLCS